MPQDTAQISREELVKQVEEMIDQSLTLERFPEQKQVFLKALPKLNGEQLGALKSQLEAESDDWKAFTKENLKQQEALIEQMEQESLEILKSAEKQLMQTQETFSEADNAQADALLNHFDD